MHKSWQPLIERAYASLDSNYREFLEKDGGYFPSFENIFNAFSLPKDQTRYVLFGQDPYPRKQSATGYAFIDGAVERIFSQNGLSKEVNRATSLRNFLKMCFVSQGLVSNQATKEEIAKVCKEGMIETIEDLKDNFLRSGVLLLNMGLVFESKEKSRYHVKMWQPFIKSLLAELQDETVELILFGNISKEVQKFDTPLKKHCFEHPYNISFIQNREVYELFLPMRLLYK
jgi:uracil-DNA glycosylase